MPAPKPNQVMPQVAVQMAEEAKTKVEAKLVKLALVKYRQPGDREDTIQLAVIGDNNIHLLNSRPLGFSDLASPQGTATKWLADAIFAALEG
jgi:hypothetical protein